MKHSVYSTGLKILVILAIAIGVGFRFTNLDHKIYWHDEVYTSMRAAGFTRGAIDNEILQNQFLTLPDIQKFQQIKPGSTTTDTIRSLAIEDPQHPPLYFVMARWWMQWFGSSMLASRVLPVLLSLLGLPFMYGLAIELFESRLAAWLATAFLALSPFDILFAQTVRQYSFLTTLVIASSWLLLRAVRLSAWQHWGWYALSVAVGLYIHPFFTLTVAAQAVYVVLMATFSQLPEQSPTAGKSASPAQSSSRSFPLPFFRWLSFWKWRLLISFALAIVTALGLYLPWMWVLSSNMQRASSTTDWTRISMGFAYLAKLWTLSFTSLFIDIDFGFDSPFTYLLRSIYLLLIVAAVYKVCRRTPKFTWLFVLTSILIPFLLLALPDLIIGGKRSAVSRYLISCYPAVQLAMAYYLTLGLSSGKQLWRWILAFLFASSILSTWISIQAESWWNKDLSFFNADTVHILNAAAEKTPLVLLSDIGNDYTNTGDLISLSYDLKGNIRFFLTSKSPDLQPLSGESNIMVFRPSDQLQAAISKNNWQLQAIDYSRVPNFSKDAKLWRLQKS